MGIRFLLLVNKQGQTRLATYNEMVPLEERRQIEGEIVRKCLARSDKQCSFVEHRQGRRVYPTIHPSPFTIHLSPFFSFASTFYLFELDFSRKCRQPIGGLCTRGSRRQPFGGERLEAADER